jgi:1-acyl-sn-glycerol-3-phosphate acyltransferase
VAGFVGAAAASRIVILGVLTATLLGPFLFARALALGPVAANISRFWCSICCQLCGLRVRRQGRPETGPTLFVANHVSYLDVLVIGSLVNATFVAKAEVASWPVLGFLARAAGTVFIERRRACSASQRKHLAECLGGKQSLVLFPEGTSSSGTQVGPFKTALFGAVEDAPSDARVNLQPLTIAFTRKRSGEALSDAERDRFAWYGEMTLLPHIIRMFSARGAEVEVIFHPSLAIEGAVDLRPSRKDLARSCEITVAQGLEDALVRAKSMNGRRWMVNRPFNGAVNAGLTILRRATRA